VIIPIYGGNDTGNSSKIKGQKKLKGLFE